MTEEGYFLHGEKYPDTVGVCQSVCSSCAFSNSPDTVRPPDVSIDRLILMTSEYDDFICHTKRKDGFRTCKRWADLKKE